MKRDKFNSKFGVVAAAAGSAIGLGNIWKFPYITGENGGAAFIFVYLICIILIGTVIMISELALGRKSQSNPSGAFKMLKSSSQWKHAGILAIATSFIILSFYTIIAGWVFSYFCSSITGKLATIAPENLASYFNTLAANTPMVLFFNLLVIGVTAFIVISGVQDGIEKYSKILMPILFIALVILIIRSVTLDGASKGLEFLFKPDFSQLTAESVLEALGHSFFTLSLGVGIIITYGSYVKKEENLVSISLKIIAADTIIALMAGTVIFPAVFAYGFEPGSGPPLMFITLPAVFQEMPLGTFFQTLFFLLVGIAAITSTISLLEVSVSFLTEEFNMNRKKATVLIAIGSFLLSIPSTLSFGVWSNIKIFDLTLFDLFDYITSNISLPLSGILTCIFVGWVWGSKNAFKEITNDGLYSISGYRLYDIVIKYIAPIAIFIILLYSTKIIQF